MIYTQVHFQDAVQLAGECPQSHSGRAAVGGGEGVTPRGIEQPCARIVETGFVCAGINGLHGDGGVAQVRPAGRGVHGDAAILNVACPIFNEQEGHAGGVDGLGLLERAARVKHTALDSERTIRRVRQDERPAVYL